MITQGGIVRREPLSVLAVATRACMAGLLILLAFGIDLAHSTPLGTVAAVAAGLFSLLSAWTPREPLISVAMISVVVEYAASSQNIGDRERLVFAAALSLVLFLVHSLAALAAFVTVRSSLPKDVFLRAVSRGLQIGAIGIVACLAIGLIGNLGPRTGWLGWVGLAGVAVLLTGLVALIARRSPPSRVDSPRRNSILGSD